MSAVFLVQSLVAQRKAANQTAGQVPKKVHIDAVNTSNGREATWSQMVDHVNLVFGKQPGMSADALCEDLESWIGSKKRKLQAPLILAALKTTFKNMLKNIRI